MCEWDSEASHWHLAAGTHNLAAAVSGGTHNLVAAFLRGQQAPARCCFPRGSHHLVAADAYGTHKLAVAPLLVAITSTRCPCATQAISPSRQWLAELISLLQQLSGGLSATRFRSMRAWAQIVGPLLHPRTRCAALATHTRRVELCMCHMWPLHAMKNADPTSRHVRVGFRS